MSDGPGEPSPPRSALVLAALATAAVPGLEVVATREPRGVEDHLEYTGLLDSVGRSWIVQAPRDVLGASTLDSAWRFVRALEADGAALPFALISPAGFAHLETGMRAAVFPQPPGTPLRLELLTPGPGLAAGLGRALAALHELPHEVAAQAGAPVYSAEECRTRLLSEVDEAARSGRVPAGLLRRWEAALEDVRAWRFQPTVVHGELDEQRVLVEDDQVAALTDIGGVHVGDPASDLAWLVAAAPEDALESVLEAYSFSRSGEVGTLLIARAHLLSELAVARWLMQGLRTDQAEVVAEAAAMLADLAEAVDGDPGLIPT
ncbi:phosphotransferase family enzyme [Serinibacter salmoneus]|uniref:Phosphotransferase family enzyme n=2 Tax=Serinibacter salmoneus TaxID=556530 RepID=A0A2A9CZK9_9MICO|nr:phosphotransferase family enzyme [Serinibacter salmoneus]